MEPRRWLSIANVTNSKRLEIPSMLTNDALLNHLRVHRSSAVYAILSRLPGFERLPGKLVGVRLRGR